MQRAQAEKIINLEKEIVAIHLKHYATLYKMYKDLSEEIKNPDLFEVEVTKLMGKRDVKLMAEDSLLAEKLLEFAGNSNHQ